MHPIRYSVDFELERNRLTTFFRLIIAIPWIVWGYLFGFAAFVVSIGAWFALLFTGRYPASLYGFNAAFIRFSGRLAAFVTMTVDDLPGFMGAEDEDYPVDIEVGPPQDEYSRAKTFFKLVLYFPQMLLSYGIQYLVMAGAFVTWWRVLFTGRQSATMQDALVTGHAYYLRSTSFLMLLTEIHPRVLDVPEPAYPADTPALPPAGGAPAPELAPPPPAPPAPEPPSPPAPGA